MDAVVQLSHSAFISFDQRGIVTFRMRNCSWRCLIDKHISKICQLVLRFVGRESGVEVMPGNGGPPGLTCKVLLPSVSGIHRRPQFRYATLACVILSRQMTLRISSVVFREGSVRCGSWLVKNCISRPSSNLRTYKSGLRLLITWTGSSNSRNELQNDIRWAKPL